MKNARYDEFQLANRHRIAFQTLILVMVLIGINGYFKASYGIWASPMLEAFVLVWLPGLYFAVKAIAKNAYFSKNDYPVFFVVLLGLAACIGFLSTLPFIVDKELSFIENGQIGDHFIGLLISIIAGVLGVALVVRRVINHRVDRVE